MHWKWYEHCDERWLHCERMYVVVNQADYRRPSPEEQQYMPMDQRSVRRSHDPVSKPDLTSI